MRSIVRSISEMAEVIQKIQTVIFRLILSFLHLVYSGLECFDRAWALFKRKLSSMLPCSDSRLYVTQFVERLTKCPKHFAIITGNERISLEDYLNLVIWCLAAGISFISFYDYTGYMKENEELYFSYLKDAEELDSNGVIFNEQHYYFRNGVYKNGYTKIIHVNILSLDDGKRLFTRVVRNICKRVIYGELISREIDEGYLDYEICRMTGFREPELAVISGSVCSTFGFLPWHIRLTEFLQVPSIRNITVTDFTSMLLKYSSCQQRFGS